MISFTIHTLDTRARATIIFVNFCALSYRLLKFININIRVSFCVCAIFLLFIFHYLRMQWMYVRTYVNTLGSVFNGFEARNKLNLV